MKVWVLQHQNIVDGTLFWTGDGLKFTTNIDRAVWFVRRVDAERALYGWVLLDAKPVEVELPGGDEPRGQSAGSDAAVNPATEAVDGCQATGV
jgi:hypothetical protein